MAMTLYLIRHGETEGSDTKRYKGSIDVPLSERGVGQIKKASAFLAEKLRNLEVQKFSAVGEEDGTSQLPNPGTSRSLAAVYSSPLGRALKSAEIIAEPHGAKVMTVPDLRERSFGIWEGMTFTEIGERYPAEFEAWARNPLQYSPIGGESTTEVRDRVIPALKGILNDHNDEAIAVVAHGGVNRIVLCHFLGIPLENIFRIEQDFAAINVIEFWERYPVAKLINYRQSCPE